MASKLSVKKVASMDRCFETVTDPRVVTAEGGRRATFLNPDRKPFTKIRVDGCLLENTTASDYIVCSEGYELVVELKGCKLNRALEQLTQTMSFWIEAGYGDRAAKRAALALCSRVPQTDGSIVRLRNQFAKKFKAPLHVVNGNNEFVLENCFNYANPLKKK